MTDLELNYEKALTRIRRMTFREWIAVYRSYSFPRRWRLTARMAWFYTRCRLGYHNPMLGYSKRIWCWTCGHKIRDADGEGCCESS